MKSTINLFKALPITTKRKKKASKELLEKTLKRGFVFAPEVIYNYSDENQLMQLVEGVGLTGEQINSSFHKSWKKVKEASIEQLVMEQMIHYFTTYGFEELGIYDEHSVYIPNEKLEVPELEENIPLTIIKGYTKKELKEKLLDMLNSGIALKEDTMDDIVEVAIFVGITEEEVEKTKNKEVKISLYEYLNLVPKAPVEFLRYIVYKATEKTLLIKSPALIEEIKEGKNLNIVKLFTDYEKKYGLEAISSIFYRFKPIFLAFRTNKKLKQIVNRIRRLAVKNHKPMTGDYLNLVTAKIKSGNLDEEMLKQELKKVNIFRKIRLAYALKFRTRAATSILYRIRNGKGYAKEFAFTKQVKAKRALDIVVDSIVLDTQKNVKGKHIYIPEHITYTLPATEKQFTGFFPSGSYVTIPNDMVFGVWWKNVKGHRIDLDLSLISVDEKIGWDSAYRNDDKTILFSGDVTDAPNGASELFYVQRQLKTASLFIVNYYNFDAEIEVPYQIFVAKEKISSMRKNYVGDPNNIVARANSSIIQKQKILGLIVTTTKESKFYFAESYVGRNITSSGNEFVENTRKYLYDFYTNTINLDEILIKAGAKIFREKEDMEIDIDLSPEALEKDSILTLLK